MPISPDLSEDEQERPMGFPGSRLKHTQTIMAGRSGGLGLRVNAKRASISKRLSGTQRQFDVKNFVSDKAPVQEVLGTTTSIPPTLVQSAPGTGSWIRIEDSDGEERSADPTVQKPQNPVPEQVPVVKVVQFIPKFKGAAEMEARRRARMAARRRPGGPLAQAPPPPLNFSSSSEDEVEIPPVSEVSSDEFDEVGAAAINGMDEGDEFDPYVYYCHLFRSFYLCISGSVFAATRTGPTSDSASDVTSVLSAGTSSMPNPSIPVSSPQMNNRARPRLSPVSEHVRYPRQQHQRVDRPVGSSSDIPSPIPKPEEPPLSKRSEESAAPSRSRGDSTSNSASFTTDNMFAKKKIIPMKPLKSSLSAMLASSGSSSNPFAEMYATISGRGESQSINVQLYFPHARQPRKPMHLNVRSDATVEEVVGFSMWSYWEEGWLPKLDEGLVGEDDPKWATRLSATGWILRIAEEDGEVDDDFPREVLLFSRTFMKLTRQLCST